MKKFLLFLLLLIPFININALRLSSDSGRSDYNFNLPNNCNNFYFYRAGVGTNDYLVCTSSDSAYVIEQPYYNTGLGNLTYFRSQRELITESLYNEWLQYNNSNTGSGYTGSNPLSNGGIGYYDNLSDKYYAFYSNVDFTKYLITYNSDYSTTLTYSAGSTANYGIRPIASNVDWFAYTSDGLNKSQRVLYAPFNIIEYNVTFHLNGGTLVIYSNNGSSGGSSGGGHGSGSSIHYEDYTIKVYDKTELNSYLDSLTIRNDLVTFNQWYYDEQLTQPYNSNNEINSNIDLYASYEYTSVDSVIGNINFNEYTFSDDYQYAVISVKDNFSQGMYIGLGFNFQYLDAYKYIISDNAFTEKSYISLNSIGSINNKYYYHLGQLDNESAMVVVLDKVNLIKLGVNNEIEHYYTFWLSDNCYVYFTNDLTQVSYYLPSGSLLQNKDISKNYDYTQKFILDSNSDLITKFISLIKNGNFSIFNIVQSLWAKMRAYKILNYLLIISFGALIVSLVKGGSRH